MILPCSFMGNEIYRLVRAEKYKLENGRCECISQSGPEYTLFSTFHEERDFRRVTDYHPSIDALVKELIEEDHRPLGKGDKITTINAPEIEIGGDHPILHYPASHNDILSFFNKYETVRQKAETH